MELGHRKILEDLDEELARIPGLYVLGHGLKSVGIPDCIGEARETAKRVAAFIESVPKDPPPLKLRRGPP